MGKCKEESAAKRCRARRSDWCCFREWPGTLGRAVALKNNSEVRRPKGSSFFIELFDGAGGAGWGWLVRGIGEVTAAGAHLVALVVGNLDADFVVAAVQDVVRWKISDGILIAKLVADVLERLIQVIHVIGEKRAAAGFFSEV